MIIFFILIVILLIILFAKIKIKIFFTLKNLEYYYCVDIFIYNLRIIKIDKTEIEKYAEKIKKKRKNKKQNKIKASKIIKKIKIEELNIDLKIGLLGIFPTIFSIPIISTLIATILPLLKTKKDKIKYNIQPVYNELAIQMKLTGTITFRIIDAITFRQT